MKRPPLPALPPPFPPAFRDTLAQLLASPARPAYARVDGATARQRSRGRSGTFYGHRPYVVGDELRSIDWAAYARSGELHVKLHEEEDRRAAAVLLDLSASLCVGAPPRRTAMLRLAAVLACLLLRELDAVWVVAPGAGASAMVSFAGSAAVPELLQHLAALPIAAASPAATANLLAQRPLPARVHWLSDFVDLAATGVLLAALRRRGGKVTGWLPVLPEDSALPALGYRRLLDPETGAELLVAVDAALAQAVREQLLALARAQDRLFVQSGCLLERWSPPAADALALAAYREVLHRCAH